MLYNVLVYIILSNNYVAKAQNYQTFSTVPIVECTVKSEIGETKWSEYIYKVCKTERLFYFMTGQDSVVITTTGVYDV